MLNSKTIAVVIPAYNEEKQILHVLKTMPGFVDRIIVVNDCSSDNTAKVVLDYIEKQEPISPRETESFAAVRKTKYDRAEIVMEELHKKDLEYFVPSVIANEHPELDRIILINNVIFRNPQQA